MSPTSSAPASVGFTILSAEDVLRLRECDSVAAGEPLMSRLSLGSSRLLPFLRAIRSFAASEARFLRGGERERDLEG